MVVKCPGSQRFSMPSPEIIRCQYCGGEVEIWTDETKAACPKCKKKITRPEGQNCLDWCKYAKECVGERLYDKYMRNKRKSKK